MLFWFVQEQRDIKQLKGMTSWVLMPSTVVDMWGYNPQLTASTSVLWPYVPFTAVSAPTARTLAQCWVGKADYNVLKHQEGVSEHLLEREKVRMHCRGQYSTLARSQTSFQRWLLSTGTGG